MKRKKTSGGGLVDALILCGIILVILVLSAGGIYLFAWASQAVVKHFTGTEHPIWIFVLCWVILSSIGACFRSVNSGGKS